MQDDELRFIMLFMAALVAVSVFARKLVYLFPRASKNPEKDVTKVRVRSMLLLAGLVVVVLTEFFRRYTTR